MPLLIPWSIMLMVSRTLSQRCLFVIARLSARHRNCHSKIPAIKALPALRSYSPASIRTTSTVSFFNVKMASNPPGKCCYQGVKHEGEPQGEFSQLGDFEVYTAKPEDGKMDYGVLM